MGFTLFTPKCPQNCHKGFGGFYDFDHFWEKLGVSTHGNKIWFIVENPNLKQMMTGGLPKKWVLKTPINIGCLFFPELIINQSIDS